MNKKQKQIALIMAGLLILGGGIMSQSQNMSLPRGIRNNNAGNIRHGAAWQGLAADQPDKSFATFISPEYGLRALAKTLNTYQKKYGIVTIRGAISRWAPPIENDTEAYIQSVARHVGASPDAPLDFSRLSVIVPMMEAIVKHENGQQPYSLAVLNKGAVMAGATA